MLNDYLAINLDKSKVFHGSNLEVLPFMADNSVDAIVTDPPYELGFMGKAWDNSGIAYSVELWRECLRVLKPGGHLLAFGGSRTWHRLAVAIEDAGFEMRDSIAWLYGSGFPKSLDISKAIDKAAGVERETVIETVETIFGDVDIKKEKPAFGIGGNASFKGHSDGAIARETEPITDDAKAWQGWGTALKPAFEPIVVARKPLTGTVAQNVLQWGTGGLNIDASRIGTNPGYKYRADANGTTFHGQQGERIKQTAKAKGSEFIESTQGRWPANIILDEYTAELLDEQSGVSVSKTANRGFCYSGNHGGLAGEDKEYKEGTDGIRGHNDIGGASRFFYVAKASKRDRNEGLEDLPEIQTGSFDGNADKDAGRKIGANPNKLNQPRQNFHPTVKPTTLMTYLINLVTPPNGTVLDPFTGSGSTGKAAVLSGYNFIGIELTADYLPIIKGRLTHAEQQTAERLI